MLQTTLGRLAVPLRRALGGWRRSRRRTTDELVPHVWHGLTHAARRPAVPVTPGSLLRLDCGQHGRASAADVRATKHGDYPWCLACLGAMQRRAPRRRPVVTP